MNKLYIVCVLNKITNKWDLIGGFFWEIKTAEEMLKAFFDNFKYIGGEIPTMQIFYTENIYASDALLFSVDKREKIIIEGGLFEAE